MMMALLGDDDGAARSVYTGMLIVINVLLRVGWIMIMGIVIRLLDVVLMTVVIVLILTVCVSASVLITGLNMESGIMIWATSHNLHLNAFDYGEQWPAGRDHNSSERAGDFLWVGARLC